MRLIRFDIFHHALALLVVHRRLFHHQKVLNNIIYELYLISLNEYYFQISVYLSGILNEQQK